MKRNLLKLFPLFVVAISCWSCERNSIDEDNTTKIYTAEKVSAEALSENSELLNKIVEIEKEVRNFKKSNPDLAARYDEDKFFIDLTYTTHVQTNDGSYHSYTFAIYNDTIGYDINNIVLSSRNGSPYEASLVTYHLTQGERTRLDNLEDLDLSTQIDIEPFDIQQLILSSRGGGSTCTELVKIGEEDCHCCEVHAPEGCTHPLSLYQWQTVDCGGGGGGGSGSGGPGSPGGPGGGGNPPVLNPPAGGGATALVNPNASDPNASALAEQICLELKTMGEKSAFIDVVNELSTATSGNKEISYFGIKQGTEMTFPIDKKVVGADNTPEVNTGPINFNVDILIHNHYGNQTLPVFSPDDLFAINVMYKAGKINLSSFTMYLVSKGEDVQSHDDDVVLALKITDSAKFIVYCNLFLNDLRMIDFRYGHYSNLISKNIGVSANELNFIKMLTRGGAGMTVYKANKSDLKKWDRLEYNENNNQIKKTKCE